MINKSTPSFDVGRQYLANVYFQDGLKVTISLAALLYLVLSTSLDAAGHVREGMSILLPVTAGSLALSAFMSFSRFDSFFAFSHSMFTGLAWILYLMAQAVKVDDMQSILDRGIPELQARAYFVLLRLLNWLDAAVSSKPNADNLVFIFEIALLVWWLSYLGMWAIVRHGYTWRAIIPAGVVLVINTYYAPKPIFSFLVVFALVGLVLLVRTNLAEKQRIWREQRIYFSQDITWDFMRNGLIYAVVVLALTAIVPNLGRNPLIRQAMTPITDRWMKAQQEVSDLYGGMNRRVTQSQAGFGSQMQLGGERNVGNAWLYTVRAIQPRYWRAVVYDEYTGRGWRNTNEATVEFDAGQLIPVPGWSSRQEISQTITVLAPVGTTVLAAPDIRSASIPLDAVIGSAPAQPFLGISVEPQTETGAVELTLLQSRREMDVGDRYIIYSNETNTTIEQLRAAGTEYPQSILEPYLQLPEDFSTRVRQLADETVVGMASPYDKAKAIETYLRAIDYDEKIAAPPIDVDPLEYFLFDIRRGYCDYYATSMVTMLRSVGVPARAVSGYAEGLFDEESGETFVGERDAHTWVEVFFPQLGWIEFEPTAAEMPLNRRESDAEINTTLGDNNQPQNESGSPEPTFDPLLNTGQQPFGQMPDELVDGQNNGFRLPWWLLLLLTPVLLALGLWLLWRMQISAPSDFTPEIVPILYERMQRWAERLRLTAPLHFTPFEQGKRLAQALPQVRQPIEVVTESFVHHQFAPQPAHNDVPLSPNSEGAENELMNAWRTMLPVFLKQWATQWMVWKNGSAGTNGKGPNGNGKSHFDLNEEVHFERGSVQQTRLKRKKQQGEKVKR